MYKQRVQQYVRLIDSVIGAAVRDQSKETRRLFTKILFPLLGFCCLQPFFDATWCGQCTKFNRILCLLVSILWKPQRNIVLTLCKHCAAMHMWCEHFNSRLNRNIHTIYRYSDFQLRGMPFFMLPFESLLYIKLSASTKLTKWIRPSFFFMLLGNKQKTTCEDGFFLKTCGFLQLFPSYFFSINVRWCSNKSLSLNWRRKNQPRVVLSVKLVTLTQLIDPIKHSFAELNFFFCFLLLWTTWKKGTLLICDAFYDMVSSSKGIFIVKMFRISNHVYSSREKRLYLECGLKVSHFAE